MRPVQSHVAAFVDWPLFLRYKTFYYLGGYFMNDIKKVKLMALAMQRYPWEQGVLAQAFLESGDAEETIMLAREAVHRQIEDGRPAMVGSWDPVTDPCGNGEAIRFAWERTGDPLFEQALKKLKDWALNKAPRSEGGIVYHISARPEFWVDSAYMLPPFLACIGEYGEALKQIDGYYDTLFVEEKGLLGHIYDDGAKRWVRRDVWATGNGWAIAGMSRIIDALPDSMVDDKQRLIGRVRQILDSAVKYLRADGLFHDVLDNPQTFVETNFAQMAAYTIYRGAASRWLDDSYIEYADLMRKAALGKIDEYGLVTGACGAPDFMVSGESVEAQAFCILMESARNHFIFSH